MENLYYDGTVEEISSIFFGHSSFKNVDCLYVKDNNDKYYDVSQLTNIRIPNGVTTISSGLIGLFESINLFKLITSIEIPNSVTKIGESAFLNCTSLNSVYYDGTIEDWCNITFENEYSNPMFSINHCYIKNKTKEYEEITEIEIPNTITKIGDDQFNGFNKVTKITIPNSVTSIDSSAFEGCSSLTSIEIPNSVTYIDSSAFEGCSSLTSIEWSAFEGCSSLTSIMIPNTVIIIGSGAFKGCTSLTSIEIPNSVTSIGWSAFEGCSSLASITIPNSLSYIEYSLFENCSSLTSIFIPSSVSSIGSSAFNNCSNLTIYCEASLKPNGWMPGWNVSNCPVVWNYKNNN